MREDNIVSTQTLSKWFLPVTPSLEGYFLFLFHQRIVEKHKWVWYCPWPYQASALWQRNFLLILSYFLQNPPRKLGGESLAYCSCLFVKCPSRNGSDLADVLPTALNYGILSCLIWWNISNCLYRRVSLCVNSCDYCLIRRNSWDSLHGDGTSAAMTAHPKNCRVEFLFGCLSEGLTRQNVPEIGVSQSSAVNGFQFACTYSINTDSVCLVDCCARLWRHGLSHSHSHSCLGMSQTRHYTFGSFSFKEVHGRWYIQEWKGCSCVLQVIENSVKANSRIAQCSANFAALYCQAASLRGEQLCKCNPEDFRFLESQTCHTNQFPAIQVWKIPNECLCILLLKSRPLDLGTLKPQIRILTNFHFSERYSFRCSCRCSAVAGGWGDGWGQDDGDEDINSWAIKGVLVWGLSKLLICH